VRRKGIARSGWPEMLDIEILNLDAVFDKAQGVITRTADLRETGPEIDREFADIESRQFASQGATGRGGRWVPLTRSTEAQKRGRGQILVRSGRLRDSLSRTGAPGQVYRATQDEVEIGSSVPYARKHQRGGKRLPAREVISLTDEQMRQLFEPVVRKGREEVQRLS
jgi:phage gpG-like protein